MKHFFCLLICFPIFASGFLSFARVEGSIEGSWIGTLKASGAELRLVAHFKKNELGEWTGTLDSPDQGAKGIKIDTITLTGEKIEFTVSSVMGKYVGTVTEDFSKIEGTWSQGGGNLPLELKPMSEGQAQERKRPQNPRKPYPYIEREVSYPNQDAAINLAGTLTIPAGEGPFPAVILITGSGAQDRDESLLGHKPFLVLADHLTRHGIAVLRLDDRGVGGSGGNIAESTSDDFAGDVLAGVGFLKQESAIDAKRIGLIGHSEGGIIAPLAAVRSRDISFIVLMAGTGLTGEEIIYLQSALIARAAGAKEEQIQKSLELNRKIFAILKEEADDKKAEARMMALMKGQAESLSPAQAKTIEAQKNQILNKWFRYFLVYDPVPVLKKVTCPVLAIIGEKDLQVPPRENLAAIRQALEAGGNKDMTVMELAGLNHLFQMAKTGNPSEYAQIEETINPTALKLMSDWILKRTNK